jgi:hypothetical protein
MSKDTYLGIFWSFCYVVLLRVNRSIYNEALDELYSRHTISLCKLPSMNLFLDTTSPTGLQRIRYLHLGHMVSTHRLQDFQVEAASVFRWMSSNLSNLQELDVEIVLNPTLPDSAPPIEEPFWKWLTDKPFSRLRGLEKFVLRVSVRTDRSVGTRNPRSYLLQLLESWDDRDYARLKASVMQPREDGVP